MPTTRALIVDDSRSARHILGKMLESFGLEVDAVESAELALTYLQTARPDVIFMDHLMPGMDGFAAVRVIKANPDTATIPVLMYTSQEGEMYLSQARALGAMGVLPKTLKHADVAAALQHLNLPTLQANTATRSAAPVRTPAATPADRDAAHRATGAFEAMPAAVAVEAPLDSTAAHSLNMPLLNMPQWAHRIATEVSAELERNNPHDPNVERGWRAWALVASLLVVVLLGVVIYQQVQMQQQLSQLQAAQQANKSAPAKPAVATPTSIPMTEAAATTMPVAPLATPRVEIEPVPYGEVPLSGARLERLRAMLETLRSEQIHGVLRIEVFMADFCLSGSPSQGYAPAADDLLVTRCDVVGNPFGDGLTVQQRQSVAFANLVASINSNVAGGIKLQLVDGGHKVQVAYPPPAATLTAAAWNSVAERNQRVEFTLPASL